MVFNFEKIMDFAMDIDKLVNLVGKVTDEIMEYQVFCQSSQKDKSLLQITKPHQHKKSQNLSQKPYFKAKMTKPQTLPGLPAH